MPEPITCKPAIAGPRPSPPSSAAKGRLRRQPDCGLASKAWRARCARARHRSPPHSTCASASARGQPQLQRPPPAGDGPSRRPHSARAVPPPAAQAASSGLGGHAAPSGALHGRLPPARRCVATPAQAPPSARACPIAALARAAAQPLRSSLCASSGPRARSREPKRIAHGTCGPSRLHRQTLAPSTWWTPRTCWCPRLLGQLPGPPAATDLRRAGGRRRRRGRRARLPGGLGAGARHWRRDRRRWRRDRCLGTLALREGPQSATGKPLHARLPGLLPCGHWWRDGGRHVQHVLRHLKPGVEIIHANADTRASDDARREVIGGGSAFQDAPPLLL